MASYEWTSSHSKSSQQEHQLQILDRKHQFLDHQHQLLDHHKGTNGQHQDTPKDTLLEY